MRLYGPPGTPEGRRKGGLISQQRRKENPEIYRLIGCNIKKKFSRLEKSESFAEAVGIILGDGGITDSQLRIYLGKESDKEYAVFVRKLFEKIFGELPAWYEYKNVIVLCLSGAGLIENLEKWGLFKGNKVQKQVDFPKWIWEEPKFQKACVRGLVDTDGGVYFHHHWIKGIKYRHFGLCFTSWSKPLLSSVSRVLEQFFIKHSVNGSRIYAYDLEEIKKYFRIFGSNNLKHRSRLNYHLSNSRKLS